jgi:hypothetical protein
MSELDIFPVFERNLTDKLFGTLAFQLAAERELKRTRLIDPKLLYRASMVPKMAVKAGEKHDVA